MEGIDIGVVKEFLRRLSPEDRRRLLDEVSSESASAGDRTAEGMGDALRFGADLSARLRDRGMDMARDLATGWIREARDDR